MSEVMNVGVMNVGQSLIKNKSLQLLIMPNVHFDYEALFVGVQREATVVTAVVPDGANGHSNVVQSDRKYSIAHCSSKWQ